MKFGQNCNFFVYDGMEFFHQYFEEDEEMEFIATPVSIRNEILSNEVLFLSPPSIHKNIDFMEKDSILNIALTPVKNLSPINLRLERNYSSLANLPPPSSSNSSFIESQNSFFSEMNDFAQFINDDCPTPTDMDFGEFNLSTFHANREWFLSRNQKIDEFEEKVSPEMSDDNGLISSPEIARGSIAQNDHSYDIIDEDMNDDNLQLNENSKCDEIPAIDINDQSQRSNESISKEQYFNDRYISMDDFYWGNSKNEEPMAILDTIKSPINSNRSQITHDKKLKKKKSKMDDENEGVIDLNEYVLQFIQQKNDGKNEMKVEMKDEKKSENINNLKDFCKENNVLKVLFENPKCHLLPTDLLSEYHPSFLNRLFLNPKRQLLPPEQRPILNGMFIHIYIYI